MTVEHHDDPTRYRVKGWVYKPDTDQEKLLVPAAYKALIRAYADIYEHAQFIEDLDKSWVVGPFVNEATATIFEHKVKKLAEQASSADVIRPKHRDPAVRHQVHARKHQGRK
ncbi:MAG: hypothetical protein AAB874_07165 [Patescibacteria group bacterium]